MACCLIGCGSNQGARREQLDRAIELLGVMPGIAMRAVSRHRETRPIGGPPDQAPFLNGACLIDTELGPHDLLGVLSAVENTLHRDRTDRWGPRTLDLDILLYDQLVLDNEVVDGSALTIPHPRMTTRRFVLEPAVEIAPGLLHPLSRCSLSDLLDNISQAHLNVAVVGVPGSGAAEVAGAVADATLARLVQAPAGLPWRKRSGLPDDGDPDAAWSAALSACARPLETSTWPDDPHGTVADYWLGSHLVAAEDTLSPVALGRYTAEHAAVTAKTVTPHVAILLQASPETLAERTATASSTMIDAGAQDNPVADLVRLQDRLLARLRCGTQAGDRGPHAVVVVAADDLSRAIAEAIAAVEAAG